MIQRLQPLFFLCCLSLCHFAAADATTPDAAPIKPAKTVQQRFQDGGECLKRNDPPCAQVELAGIPTSTPEAKILEARIAAAQDDFDRALRLLLPLQSNASLDPDLSASLHATLAQAYENQGNILRALEQRMLVSGDRAVVLQQPILQLLTSQPRETLLEMRGESQDTLTQGWIDLALAAAAADPVSAVAQWRTAYPDHPVAPELLKQLTQSNPDAPPEDTLKGTVALLVPLENPAFAHVIEALQAGITAAHGPKGAVILRYGTSGKKEDIVATYQRALAEGAQYVIGPLTREETSALAAAEQKLVPTLALNLAEQEKLPENLYTFGLPVEAEAAQVARIARASGLQSAVTITAASPLAKRMEQAFLKEWQVQEGTIAMQVTVTPETQLAELKSMLPATDMLFLAADAEQARAIRPYLPQAIPTYGVSRLYDGKEKNPANQGLNAVHFVDMPWVLNSDHPDFAAYRKAAEQLPPGEAQRWFAVGVDAWHILTAQAAGKPVLLHGLSGNLHVENGVLMREVPMAQFRPDGVELE